MTSESDADLRRALIDNRHRFLAFLERRVGDRATAEEILQAACERGLERAGDIREGERVVAWFYRLLRNAVADHWRALGAERRAAERLAREMGGAHVPAPAIPRELCRCFESQLALLRPDYAEILRDVDLGEERPGEFAARHGLTSNNAMVRLHRARRALRQRLLHLCGDCAEQGCLDCSCRTPRASGCKAGPPHPSACSEGEEPNANGARSSPDREAETERRKS